MFDLYSLAATHRRSTDYSTVKKMFQLTAFADVTNNFSSNISGLSIAEPGSPKWILPFDLHRAFCLPKAVSICLVYSLK